MRKVRAHRDFAQFLSVRQEQMARPRAGTFTRSLAGSCQRPVVVESYGCKPLNYRTRSVHTGPITSTEVSDVVTLETEVRCRQCENCLKAKAYFWRQRAIGEIGFANRTWFATLTFAPANQLRLRYSAASRLAASNIDFDTLPHDQQYREIAGFAVKEFQTYMKRLRKGGAKLRYLLVVEAHKSGLPHLHALLHEPNEPCRHALLSAKWTAGFSQFKLVEPENKSAAAGYVTKYITKCIGTRMRGSVGYGSVPIGHDSAPSGI